MRISGAEEICRAKLIPYWGNIYRYRYTKLRWIQNPHIGKIVIFSNCANFRNYPTIIASNKKNLLSIYYYVASR